MSTKSNRSSGTQWTQKGVNQGNVLVDPVSGNPITVITDISGNKRLAVDANITLSGVTVDVHLTSATDSITIGNPNNSNTLNVNPDGSINADVVISASTDSILAGGTEDGTFSGTRHALKIDSNENLNVINMGTMIPKIFDYIDITNTVISGQTLPSSLVYKVGGISGTTVATLTLSYDGSGNLLTVGRT